MAHLPSGLRGITQDVRYAWRGLWRSRLFAATTVLTLSVGIGLVTVVFTIFNAYVLRPFAVREPFSLYELAWQQQDQYSSRFRWRDYEALRERADLFDAVIAERTAIVGTDGRRLGVTFVSGNYFDTLGVGLRKGRHLTGFDASTPGHAPVAVLSDAGWARLFDRDERILGRTVTLRDHTVTIVGVLRPEFAGLDEDTRDLWMPLTMYPAIIGPDLFGAAQPRELHITTRVKRGVSQDRVRSALLSFLLTASDIRNRDGSKPALGQLRADVRQQATPTPLTVELVAQLSPVFAAFGLVLVAACANVSNVMLARGNARHREIAVRLSLGAARSRIVRALLTEGVLIALLAGVVGLVLGAVTLRLGTAVFLGSLPAAISNQLYVMPLTLDHRVFLFALAVSAAATLAFALLPALQATRLTLTDALRGQPSGHLHASTLRNLLIIGQVTVSIVLLVCAATLVRNSAALAATDLGFETAGVLRVRPPARDAHALLPRIVERLAQEAGEDGIAVTSRYPLSGGVDRVAVVAADETPASAGETRSGEARSDGARSGQGPSEETRPGAAGGDCGGGGRIAGEGSRDDAAAGRQGCAETRAAANAVPYRFVSPEYFSLLRIPIVRGRNFVADETAVEAPVGIISAATARRLWPGVDPIGRTIRIEAPEGREVDALPGYATVTIVGVAQDVVSGMVYQGRDIAQLYLPTSVTGTRGTSLLVRGRRADSVLARVQPLLADPLAFEVLTLDELLDMQIYPLRAASLIGSLLGAIALVLTIAGLYGVLAYTWGQRTREIGIRIALGATTRTVISLVMKQSARLTAMGAAVGLAIAYAALEGLNAAIELRNVAVIDAYAFAGAIAIVAGAAALAAYAPARRAARVDPSRTLRADG